MPYFDIKLSKNKFHFTFEEVLEGIQEWRWDGGEADLKLPSLAGRQ